MITALVWVLMVSKYNYSGMVSYSPPVATLEDCERLQNNLDSDFKRFSSSKCIQVNMVFPKK